MYITFTCPSNDHPHFAHVVAELKKTFSSEGADHVGHQHVALMHTELPTLFKRRKIAGCFDTEHPDELTVVICLDDEPMALRLKASAFFSWMTILVRIWQSQ